MSLWINGKWLIGEGPRRQRANPVSGETVWQGHDASALQVESAVDAARHAFPAWAKRAFSERQQIVETFTSLLEANKAALTETIARETAKPRWGSGDRSGGDDQ